MKLKISIIFVWFSILVNYTLGQEITYNITNYGAVPDSKVICTMSIQAAVDAAHDAGGGSVLIPAGNFISGTIILKNNVEIYLARGARLLGSPNYDDYPRQPQSKYRSQKDDGGWYALIYAEGAENIAISGSGTIDGQGSHHTGRRDAPAGDRDGRPRNILLISCKKISISGVTVKSSASWNQHYLDCEDLTVDNIRVYNHSNSNNDGIDIDGCRRVILTNSTFDSSDDAIVLKSTGPAPCENIVINNCIASSFCNGIKMGTESTGGFRNINISNCIIKPSIHPEKPDPNKNPNAIGITGLSLEIVDGGVMEGISVNNLTIEGTQCPVYVRLAGRNRKHRVDAQEPSVGRMSNISINNIIAYGSGNWACSVTGIPGHKIENVRLSNFSIVQQGGVKEGDYLPALEDVEEKVKAYPQPTNWYNLPVCGLFMRHIDGISVTNFSINTLKPDPRPLFMAHDVNNLSIKGVYAGDNVDADLPFFKKEVTNDFVKY